MNLRYIKQSFYILSKTLEDNLDFNPITRRAWNEAIKINQEYQKGLK